MTNAGDPPLFRLAHAAPGRVRLSAVRPLDHSAMAALADRVAAAAGAGARRVVARPNTGSLIVETAENREALLARLAERGVIALAPPTASPSLRAAAAAATRRAEAAVAGASEGALDLRAAAALVYLVAALLQLARGRVLGPALTMALGASALLRGAAEGGDDAAGADAD